MKVFRKEVVPLNKIIDCHVHLPAFDGLSTLEEKKTLLLEAMDRHGVEYAIVIPDNVKGSAIGDLEECLGLFKNEPRIFVMGTINILKVCPESIRGLRDHFLHQRIHGLKIFPGHDPHFPNDSRLIPVFELLQEYRQPLVIHTGGSSKYPDDQKYTDPRYIAMIAKEYPDLPIVIAHYYWPQVEYCFEMTIEYPNIYYDTSGLADEEVLEETGEERIKNILAKTMKNNRNKVLFGTDFGMCDIGKHQSLVKTLDLDEKAKEAIFIHNASKLFQLNID